MDGYCFLLTASFYQLLSSFHLKPEVCNCFRPKVLSSASDSLILCVIPRCLRPRGRQVSGDWQLPVAQLPHEDGVRAGVSVLPGAVLPPWKWGSVITSLPSSLLSFSSLCSPPTFFLAVAPFLPCCFKWHWLNVIRMTSGTLHILKLDILSQGTLTCKISHFLIYRPFIITDSTQGIYFDVCLLFFSSPSLYFIFCPSISPRVCREFT